MTHRFHGNHILTGIFFLNFDFSCLKSNKSFRVAFFFKSLDHFMLFLFVLFASEPILVRFLRFWKRKTLDNNDLNQVA